MDFTIFRSNEAPWVMQTTTAPRVTGTEFTSGAQWVKSIRFWRGSNAMYGKIEAQIYSFQALDAQNIPYQAVPNTYISTTLTAGTGPTGWVDMVFPTPVRLPNINFMYRVVVKFPGGANNRIPFATKYWFRSGSAKNTGMVQSFWDTTYSADNYRQSAYAASSTLQWPSAAADGDAGVDVVCTDIDPAEPAQPGPVYRLWGSSGPPAQVAVADFKQSVVTGLDIDVTKDCFVTHLRVYRVKGYQGEDEREYMSSYTPGVGYTTDQVPGPNTPYIITAEVYNGGVAGAIYEVNSNGTAGTYVEGTFTQFYNLGSQYSSGYLGWQSARLDAPTRLVAGKRYRVVISWPWSRPSTPNWYTASGSGNTPKTVGPLKMVGRSNGFNATGAYASKPGSSPNQPRAIYFPTTPTTDQVWTDLQVTTKDPYLSDSGGGYGDDREPNATAQRLWGMPKPDQIVTHPGASLGLQEFRVTSPAKAHGLRFYRPDTSLSGRITGVLFLIVPGLIYGYRVVLGTLVEFVLDKDSGWIYAPFTAPVRLSPGQNYVIALDFPSGYPDVPGYFKDQDIDGRTSGVLSIPTVQNSYQSRDNNAFVDITVVPWAGSKVGAAGTAARPSTAVRAWAGMDVSAAAVLPSIGQSMRWSSAMEFQVDQESTAHGLHFYRPTTLLSGQPHARVYRIAENSGTYYTEVIGSDVTFVLSGTGWQYAAFRNPFRLKAHQRYLMAFYWPDGMPTLTHDFYDVNTEAGNTDTVVGVLRIPCPLNAHMSRQSLLGLPSEFSDTISYMATPTSWHMLVDISVTPGAPTAPAALLGQERDDALSLMGMNYPSQAVYLQSQPWKVPGAVVSHEFYTDVDCTIHGVRWFRYAMAPELVEVVIYRVSDRFVMPNSRTTAPPATMFGWVYIPFSTPVVVSKDERYRIAILEVDAFQSGISQFTSTRRAGALNMVSSWTIGPATVLEYPRYADGGDYHIDISYTTGTAFPPATHKTLFADDEPSLNVVEYEFGQGYTLGTRFSTDQDVYATAIRFWRPAIAVGVGTVLGAIWAGDGAVRFLVPNSSVVFKMINNEVGWMVCALPYPVRLFKGVGYRVGVYFPGHFPFTTNYFLPGGRGHTGTVAKYGPNGSLYFGGVNSVGDRKQGVYQSGSIISFPGEGGTNDPQTGAFVPSGENYWVDVVATNITPDYVLPVYPRMPLSYSAWGDSVLLRGTGVLDGDVMAGLEFYVDTPCYVHAYKYPRIDPNRQIKPVLAGLYQINKDGSGTPIPDSFGTIQVTDGFWQRAHLSPAIKLEPGKRYKLVMQFTRAYPGGSASTIMQTGYDQLIVRGPLRIPANADATGGATVTWEDDVRSFVYPRTPLQESNAPYLIKSFCIDLFVSTNDPYEDAGITRSIHDRRAPASLQMQELKASSDVNTGQVYEDGITGGMEFYVTGDQCYVTELRYWRESFPTSTVIAGAAVFEVTTPASKPYTVFTNDGYGIRDNSAGTIVPGTSIMFDPWPQDPSGSEVHAAGWVSKNLPVPIKLTKGKTYRLGAFFPFASQQASVPKGDKYWDAGAGAAGRVDGPLVAPNRAQSTGEAQSMGSFTYGFNTLTYPSEYTLTNGVIYWLDVAIIDQAPRTVSGGMVQRVLSINPRERRASGVDASFIATPDLNVQAVSRGNKDTGSQVTVALEVNPSPFSGKSLVLYSVGVQSQAQAISKHVYGGTVDHDTGGIQVRFTRTRRATADDADHQMEVYGSAYEAFRWGPIPREAISLPFNYNPQDIRFIAQNIMSRQFLHMDLPIHNPTITWRLSGPFELTGTLAPPYADLLDLGLDEWSTFIHVEYLGQILGTGILMPWSSNENELSIEAIGVSTYPHGIPYLETFSQFFPDIMTVVREMWRHIQSFPNGNMNILLPSGYMGVPLYGRAHYDDQTGALLGYEAWSLSWTDFTDCGQFIDNLAVSTPFDYQEVNAWNSNHTDILHGINFGYPRLGAKRPELRFVQGENIVDSIPISEPEDAFATDIIIKGAGEGYTQIFVWVGVDLWDRLRRVTVITDEQVATQAIGYGIANQEILRRLYARGISQIVVEAFHLHAPLGTYSVGDDILIEGMQPWVGEFWLWHRITSIEFNRDTGLCTLEVARSESFRYGRPR